MGQRTEFTRRRLLRVGAFTALAALTSRKTKALGTIAIATARTENFEALLGERMHFVAAAPQGAGFHMQVAHVQRHPPLPAEIRVPGIELRRQPFSVFFDCHGELPLGGHGLAWVEHPGFQREPIFMATILDRSGDREHFVYEAVFN